MADSETQERRDDPEIERRMLFAFESLGDDRFRTEPFPSGLLRLYGGQVVAQALAAAQLTAPPDRLVHSCHAYFVRPGEIDQPLDFTVSRDRDGRSFSARRVSVEQGGALILSMSVSLHDMEEGPRAQFPMPDVLPPDQLRSMSEWISDVGDTLPRRHMPFWRREMLFDWRPVEPFRIRTSPVESSRKHYWIRSKATLSDDPAEHQRFFAYASDLHILHAGLAPLGIAWAVDDLQTASLDHAIWFHDRFRADEWLLYALDSPATSGARALGRGSAFTTDGRLVASVAQEGLVRLLPVPRTDMI